MWHLNSETIDHECTAKSYATEALASEVGDFERFKIAYSHTSLIIHLGRGKINILKFGD